uniref:Caspase-14-like n=1 Tax=Bos mutus grunniens TaxID=30521 RepID=A0A8B9YN36_BOSMU
MAFLVAGTLQVASQVADAQESLGRKGKYSVKDPRVALALCSPEVSASTAALLEGVFQTLGFESCRRQEASIQGFRGELTRFREQLDAHGGSVGCAFVALVARPWQLRQSQQLVRELSRCKALWGRPKVFLLLSALPGVSGPAEPPGGGPNRVGVGWAGGPRPSLQARVLLLLHPAVPEPGAFLASLGELCGRRPHWSLLQLLTEVFSRTAEESAGAAYCPVLRSSLRGALCLGNVEPWGPEPEPGPSAQYDLSGARAALLLAVTQGRLGAQHDVEALGGLCQALGFETTLRTDPTAQTFQEEMAQFRKRLDAHRGPVSCALVALMAHGGPQGQLLGADGQERQLEVLVQELSHCGALRGRPKIFLLQACRGGHRDAGVGPAALPWFRCWLRAPPATPFQADVLHVCTDVQGRSSRGPTPGSPNQADVLMVYAAAEGCVAYRDEKGSDFIQTLVEVLRADPKADLLELMTEVNRQVCELDVLGPDCDDRRKACLEIRSSLRRRLCLQV